VLTKHLHENDNDELKCDMSIENIEVKIAPKVIENEIVIRSPSVVHKPKNKIKIRMVKTKVTVKKSLPENPANTLHNLEEVCEAERALNIDLDLYQMEDF
jgi:hypothetical protein